ncbi:hypothetical protein PJ900_14600 [Tistrella mobilis]|nr:hypothetical protein [Tistrella mobilis]
MVLPSIYGRWRNSAEPADILSLPDAGAYPSVQVQLSGCADEGFCRHGAEFGRQAMPEQDAHGRTQAGQVRPTRLNTRELLELAASLLSAAEAGDTSVGGRLGSLPEELLRVIDDLPPDSEDRSSAFRFLDIEQASETVTILIRPNDRDQGWS